MPHEIIHSIEISSYSQVASLILKMQLEDLDASGSYAQVPFPRCNLILQDYTSHFLKMIPHVSRKMRGYFFRKAKTKYFRGDIFLDVETCRR